MKKILLIGGGGHCRSVIDVVEQEGKFEIAGIVDNNLNIGEKILQYEVVGKDEDLKVLREKYEYAIITVGQIKTAKVRIKLFSLLKSLDYKLPSIVSPKAYVSKYASVGEGTVIMHGAIINVAATVGKNCIINSKALIEHDAIIGDFTHISTSSVVNGECRVGKKVFFGSGSVLANCVSICDNVLVGAGSVVVKNITESGIYVGNPARKIKEV